MNEVEAREKDLLERLVALYKKSDELDQQLKATNEEYDRVEAQLYEYLENCDKEKTASYTGIGYATVCKPKVRASVTNDQMEAFKKYLGRIKRRDLLKETVHASTLAVFVKDLIDQGKPVPECVSYYLQPVIKVYPK